MGAAVVGVAVVGLAVVGLAVVGFPVVGDTVGAAVAPAKLVDVPTITKITPIARNNRNVISFMLGTTRDDRSSDLSSYIFPPPVLVYMMCTAYVVVDNREP